MEPGLSARPLSIWADSEAVFVTADDEHLHRLHDDNLEWERWPETMVLGPERGLWGLGPGCVWVAGYNGFLIRHGQHMIDASHWPEPADHSPEDLVLNALWGSGETVFFRTRTVLGRIREDQSPETDLIHVLADWGTCGEPVSAECDWRLEILDMWGNDAENLFLATLETRWTDAGVVRTPHVLWYDGLHFHEM